MKIYITLFIVFLQILPSITRRELLENESYQFLYKIEVNPGSYTRLFYKKDNGILASWNANDHLVLLYDKIKKVLIIYCTDTKTLLVLDLISDVGNMIPNYIINNNHNSQNENITRLLSQLEMIYPNGINKNNTFQISRLFTMKPIAKLTYNNEDLMNCTICKKHTKEFDNILEYLFRNINCSSNKKNFDVTFFYGTNKISGDDLENIRIEDVEDLISLMRKTVCKRDKKFCHGANSKLTKIDNMDVCVNSYVLNNKSWQINMKNQLGNVDLLVQYNSTLNILAFLNNNLEVTMVFNGKSGLLALFNITTGIGAVVNQRNGKARIVNKYQQEIKKDFKRSNSPLELQHGFQIIYNAIKQSSKGLNDLISFDNEIINMNKLFGNFFDIKFWLSKKNQAFYERAIDNFGALFEQATRQLGDIGKICVQCGIIGLISSVVGLKDLGLAIIKILNNFFKAASNIFKPEVIFEAIVSFNENFSNGFDNISSFFLNNLADFIENVTSFTGSIGDQIKKFMEFCKIKLQKKMS